jgi:multiple antibiotic resistance protein
MLTDFAISAFITLLVTVDPPGLAPVFLVLTHGMNREQRRSVAIRGATIAFCVLVGFILIGSSILSALGISLPAFRVAGGLLLFYIAFEMIFAKRQDRKEKATEEAITKDHIANVAVFPLAIPLIAGPGAISASILLSAEMQGTLAWRGMLVGIVAVVMALVMLSFMLSERIDRYLGITGRSILTRLLGVLLAALSVQFVADGVKALIAAG